LPTPGKSRSEKAAAKRRIGAAFTMAVSFPGYFAKRGTFSPGQPSLIRQGTGKIAGMTPREL
jgi:hypothetical protein